MNTAAWSTYAGPGRIAISPVPDGALRGYKRHPGLSLIRPGTPAEIAAHLAKMDARSVAASLCVLTYPWRPVLMGSAPAGERSYRTEVAKWLAWHGVAVTEIDPSNHRPRRVHPSSVPGLAALLAT